MVSLQRIGQLSGLVTRRGGNGIHSFCSRHAAYLLHMRIAGVLSPVVVFTVEAQKRK